jgi:hypothetical protein
MNNVQHTANSSFSMSDGAISEHKLLSPMSQPITITPPEFVCERVHTHAACGEQSHAHMHAIHSANTCVNLL